MTIKLDELERYSWETNEYRRMSGTDDWVRVADLGEGGYSWTEFRAYYSPSARRYFWHGDAGCSCNSWNEALDTSESFQNGARADLLRGWEAFAKEHQYTITTTVYLDGVAEIKRFKEPSSV